MRRPQLLRPTSHAAFLVVGLAACSSSSKQHPADAQPDIVDGADSAVTPPDGRAADAPTVDAPAPDTGPDAQVDRRTEARLTISPSAQHFAAMIGQPSSPLAFTVTNAGNAPVGPLVAQITGPDADSFIIKATTCLELAPQGECLVSVVFAPQTCLATFATATLVVSGPAPDSATVTANLVGGGTSLNPLMLLPLQGDLGSVGVGDIGPAVTFTLTYDGNRCAPGAAGPFTVAVSSPEFLITDDRCGAAVLEADASCLIRVALRPTSAGAKSATLTVSTTSGAGIGKTLTGTGILTDASIADAPDGGVDAAVVDAGALDTSSEARGETWP
jgi:hypothetical protein